MRARARLLSFTGLMMLLVPAYGYAQERGSLSELAFPKAAAVRAASAGLEASQPSGQPARVRDSLLNGTVIGLAVGAVSGIAFAYAVRDSDLDAGQYAYSALIFGGIGAGLGAGLDAMLDRSAGVVLRSPRRVAIVPTVSRKITGIRVLTRW